MKTWGPVGPNIFFWKSSTDAWSERNFSAISLLGCASKWICIEAASFPIRSFPWSIGVWAGGAAAPQILGNSDFLGSERKFGQSQFLQTSPFYLIILKTWILTWSRRNNPVTLQWLLSMWWVIYIFVVFFRLGTILHCTSWNGLFQVENWLK